MIIVSIAAPINKKMNERTNNLIESLTTIQNFIDFLLEIVTDTNPPAIAPMKYAPISKDPWGMNIITAAGKDLKPPEASEIMPIAADNTVAFHAKMNIAPEPNRKENRKDIVKTLVLFKNISMNLPPNSNFPLIRLTSAICSENTISTTPCGNKTKLKDMAIIIPEKNVM